MSAAPENPKIMKIIKPSIMKMPPMTIKSNDTNANSAKNDSARQQFVLKQVTKIVEKETAGKKLVVKIVGEPVQSMNSKNYMMSDLVGLIPLVAVVVIISLYLSFHTMEGTLLPLITVLMSASISVGLMGLLGYTFTLVSSVIPVALIAVGSAYGIHVLTHYYVEVEKLTGEITREMHEEALLRGLKEVWKAVLLAGITTVVGFISLITSPLQPLHSFSIFTAVGVGLSLILSVTFIPAILLLKNPQTISIKRDLKIIRRAKKKVKEKLERLANLRGNKSKDEASGDTLYSIFKFFCGSHTRMTLTSLLIIVLSVVGLKMLNVDTALINYFPKESEFRKDIDYVDNSFAGTNSVFFLVEGPERGDISNPDILKAVDEMEEHLKKKFPEIGKIVSLTSFVKRINQVFNNPATNISETDAAADTGSMDSMDFGDMDFGDEVPLDDMEQGAEGEMPMAAAANEDMDANDPNGGAIPPMGESVSKKLKMLTEVKQEKYCQEMKKKSQHYMDILCERLIQKTINQENESKQVPKVNFDNKILLVNEEMTKTIEQLRKYETSEQH